MKDARIYIYIYTDTISEALDFGDNMRSFK